ncbi:MAG: hypothetical protein ACK5TA_06855, partial [bacterium]
LIRAHCLRILRLNSLASLFVVIRYRSWGVRVIRDRNPIFQTCCALDIHHVNEDEERRDKQLEHANFISDKAWMTSGKISWF